MGLDLAGRLVREPDEDADGIVTNSWKRERGSFR